MMTAFGLRFTIISALVVSAQALGISLCADGKGCVGWSKNFRSGRAFVSLMETPAAIDEPVTSVTQYEELPSKSKPDDLNNVMDEEEEDAVAVLEEAIASTTWVYENGLLVATDRDGNDQCLGLDKCSSYGREYLFEKACKPYYTLKLQDCPTQDDRRLANGEDNQDMSRHMRFLAKPNGQIQSLVPVLDPNGEDISMSEKPFCLTVLSDSEGSSTINENQVYLMPCVEDEEDQEDNKIVTVYTNWYGGKKQMLREQFFNFDGDSEPFLMPLQRSYGYDDVVEMVYHVGIHTMNARARSISGNGDDNDKEEESSAATAAVIKDDDYYVVLTSEDDESIVDTIETRCKSSIGVLRFNPKEYGVDGPLMATMKGSTTSNTVSVVQFEVEPKERHVGCSKAIGASTLSAASSQIGYAVLGFFFIIGGLLVAASLSYFFRKGKSDSKATTAPADGTIDVIKGGDDDGSVGKDTVHTDEDGDDLSIGSSIPPPSLDEDGSAVMDEDEVNKEKV